MVSDFGDFMEMLALGYIVLCLSESYLLLAVYVTILRLSVAVDLLFSYVDFSCG